MMPPARRALRMEGGAGSFEEIYVATPRHSEFAKIIAGGRAMLVVAMRRTSNVGMGWIQVRGCTPLIESLIL
jgi:hypothetical protein